MANAVMVTVGLAIMGAGRLDGQGFLLKPWRYRYFSAYWSVS